MPKRLFDIIVSAVALILLLPAFVAIALAVKVSSPGPVFFRQIRVGRGGKEFQILKFRSMRAGVSGASVTVLGDDRITSVGRFLRGSKLDELPQLWNVLVGEMSIVGPRPEVPRYVKLYREPSRELILSMRPGLTDPMTLQLRDEESVLAAYDDPIRAYETIILPRKVQGYEDYVTNHTFLGDLNLILRTLVAIFRPGDRS